MNYDRRYRYGFDRPSRNKVREKTTELLCLIAIWIAVGSGLAYMIYSLTSHAMAQLLLQLPH